MKMNKRIWSLVLCAAMVLVLAAGLLPQRAQAASDEQLGLILRERAIYAQGNAITLESGSKSGYTKIKVGTSYVDFSQLGNYYDGVCNPDNHQEADLSAASIYGGWIYGGSGNTSITIDGGNVALVYGGSGSGDMSGSATITMKNGRAQQLVASGWGGSVSSSTITVNGGTVSVTIRMVGKGVTGDATTVITGGSVAKIQRDDTTYVIPGGELSLYTRGIGELLAKKDSIDNCVLLEGNTWYINGNTAKAMNGNYLTVNSGQTLTVGAGQTFSGGIDNYGTIYNYGTIGDTVDNQGVIHNYGTISAEVNQDDVGTVYNYGTVGTVNGGYLTKEVSHWVYYCTMDQSAWASKAYNHQDDYTGTVIPSAGHVLADSFDAVVTNANGSKTYLKSGVDFEYDSATGKIRIPNSKMTGPVHIRTYTLVDLGSDALDLRLSEDSFTFNGKEHKPVLLWNGSPVGEDGITATYENNVSAGTGKVTFTADEGSGYTGQLTLEFTINPVSVEDVTWTLEALTYNGETRNPTISGKLGDYDLQCPADYLSDGAAQKNAGEYTLTVEGKGNFTGTKTLDWTIAPADINDAEVTGLRVEYNGRQQGNDQVVLRYGGATLEKNVDYWFYQGSSGDDVGSYKQVIKGKGNFTGSKEVTVEIIPKKLTVVEVRVEDKGYDGTTTGKILEVVLDGLGSASVDVDYAASTAEFATPEVGQNKTVTGTIYLTGTNAHNYAAPLSYTTTGNIFNDLYAQQGKEYTVNTNDWTSGDFVVTPAEGYQVCATQNGTFGEKLCVNEEGEAELTFYVKRLSDGRISNPAKETYKIDRTAPTGGITIGERSWEGFFVAVYDKLTNQDLGMTVEAADALSGVEEVAYVESETTLTVEELAAKTGWKKGNVEKIKAEDGKKVIYYVRITDKAGNVAYLASNGTSFDTLAPGIVGVKAGVTYYVSTAVTVNDKNLVSVKLNGEEVGASFTIEGGASAEYTIVATDKAGNETVMTFATGKLEEAEDVLKDLTSENVTLGNESDIDGLLEDLKEQDLTKATAEEKAAVEDLIEKAEKLQEQLEKLMEAANTEAIDKAVEILEKDNGTIKDIDVVKQAIADIDKLLEDFDSNLTEDEERIIEETRAEIVKLLKELEKKAAATTPNTGDLLLPMAGTVCVIAILGMAATLVGFKRRRR